MLRYSSILVVWHHADYQSTKICVLYTRAYFNNVAWIWTIRFFSLATVHNNTY